MRRRVSSYALPGVIAGCLLSSLGCASQPIVQADALPLRHVVVYRNGVAYFERAGHVDLGEVRFKMKQTEVGDFLATLAVMEQNGSSVRAAAFPLDTGDDEDDAEAGGDGAAVKPKRVKTEDEKKGLRTVVLSLDGRAHDLAVGYVAESPVWKPCYRLIVHPDGQADLQAWGVVENVSGEDWKDVDLTLIAGAPLAFQSQLGDPVIPVRPTVTDQGEVIAAVPRGETSLGQEEARKVPATSEAKKSDAPDVAKELAEAPPAAAPAPQSKAARHQAAGRAAHATAAPMGAAVPAAAPPPPPAEPVVAAFVPSQPRNLQSLAAVAAEGATTRYRLPNKVTVPDKSATMVMLVARRVPGEALFLYAPDGGVPDSSSHPFRVARFTNQSGGLLERGPIAVFEEGSFLGQGLVEPLPEAATATVPFALERSLAVDQESKRDEQGARLVKIDNGELTVERDMVNQTKYRLRNGGELPAKVLVRHPRQGGTRLFSPPKDTEDNVGTGTALVPAKVAPHTTGELVVDERATVRRQTDWFSAIADTAFKAFVADPGPHRDVAAKLTAAWTVRDDIVKKQEARSKLQQEQNGLSQSTEETRKNLRAIERNKVADALRVKLTQRLTETSNRLDDVTKQIVDLDSKLSELRVRFKEDVRDVKLWIPPTST
jgi:Domain of unknown function (DUF4139)